MSLPDFKNHAEVDAYAQEILRTGSMRGLEYIAMLAELPDLRTEEELAVAADCTVDECPKKVFIDTRDSLCQGHRAMESLDFIFRGIVLD